MRPVAMSTDGDLRWKPIDHFRDDMDLDLSAALAEYHAIDSERSHLEKLKKEYRAVLLAHLQMEEVLSVKTEAGAFGITNQSIVVVDDLNAFNRFVADTGSWEFVSKSPIVAAVRERIEAGETIPGVHLEEIEKLTIRK